MLCLCLSRGSCCRVFLWVVGTHAVQYFVLWGDADGGFFCPEPWLGGPDSLNTGAGRVVLHAGEAFTWSYTIASTRL